MNATIPSDEQMRIKQTIREYFGPAEIRFNAEWITVTVHSIPNNEFESDYISYLDQCVDNLLGATSLGTKFCYEVVGENRFKLFLNTAVDAERNFGWETENDDYSNIKDNVREAVDAAHEQTTLESLQEKQLKFDIDAFITSNLSAALELLKTSKHTITLDEVKELMAFSYLSGMWANSRMADLELLSKVFNERFKFAAEQYGNA